MRVLYISGMYPNPTYPQKGIFCHEQVKALIQEGIEVDVLVPMAFYDKEYTTKIWEYEGIKIRYIRYLKYPGIQFFQFIGMSLYLSLLCSHINFERYDVIHADAPLPAGDAARILSNKYGIPYVLHGHGLDVFSDESYAKYKNCTSIMNISIRAYQQANAVIGVSRKVLDKIQTKVDIKKNGFVVYNGVDIKKFYPKPFKHDKIIVTSIGNLIPLKGHEYTLEALKRLNDKYPGLFHMTLIGRGPLEDKLKQLAQQLGIEQMVDFKGYVPYKAIRDYLQKSDIFVLPSYYEALGCVYLEAMACGIPSIGCRGNGIDEIIEDGVDGYLIHNKNVEDLVRCIEKLLDPSLRGKMGINCRKKIEDNYTWQVSAIHLKKIYNYVKNGFKKNN